MLFADAVDFGSNQPRAVKHQRIASLVEQGAYRSSASASCGMVILRLITLLQSTKTELLFYLELGLAEK
mgnify:CR=1